MPNILSLRIVKIMKALFVELPPCTRSRADYLDDDSFRALQKTLMENPKAGDVIEGVGGLRNLRYADARSCKGKRGGLMVIFFGWSSVSSFGFLPCTTKPKCST